MKIRRSLLVGEWFWKKWANMPVKMLLVKGQDVCVDLSCYVMHWQSVFHFQQERGTQQGKCSALIRPMCVCLWKSVTKITWKTPPVLNLLGHVILPFQNQMRQSLLVKDFPLRCHAFIFLVFPWGFSQLQQGFVSTCKWNIPMVTKGEGKKMVKISVMRYLYPRFTPLLQ